MLELFKAINNLVWGPPLLLLLVGTGVYLTLRLGVFQIGKLPTAFRLIFSSDQSGQGDVSSFAALCTALAATVGTGNIVGVATAITTGGPGALFWMWVAAFFGMATKYAEGFLAIKYRTKDANGQVAGGPMHYITLGMGQKWKPLAVFFAISGVLVALLGIGTFSQVNSITASLETSFGLEPPLVSVITAISIAFVVFGGIEKISDVSTKIVPFMAILYILASITVLAVHWDQLLPTLALVFKSAFTPAAAVGGFAGATVQQAIQRGIARGVFSNESGLGSAPIAPLTQAAFATVFGNTGSIALTISLVLFAFTTILGWSYYGERCIEFLFGTKSILPYRLLFVAMVALGGFLKLDLIWTIADIVNGLMALPNLIALLALSPVIIKETRQYFAKRK
ncbi:TPA: sodium:alanine symporter family protein [Streptococcus suis]|uniref:alanine/glycine:cation symporter family protein n=1 Tax=Streptococcus suis TaxID=1307 RepID=UPI00207CC0B8|nr:sodium:alanine symporter family protein [Streptococcus suis]MCO0826251.1 sodium:alanine symporter family protein [Streptococcus suis]MCO0828275.1 sodium:alanine symporter family protein [Streptococcus suis]MCO0846864.1 sodium:alanine symporter family protein [Streptococcus suis]MCO0854380.1 sodium:alanine symporter family protein [Streptococcus suis]HEM4020240.1 sodium:alanine symporter family protein [Streptococcus suis]